ncbi:MAG: PPC domain-containing protein [Planctomycetes bacterium]|nr:PPC domain-containing protein [Planctomycetota bacterium]
MFRSHNLRALSALQGILILVLSALLAPEAIAREGDSPEHAKSAQVGDNRGNFERASESVWLAFDAAAHGEYQFSAEGAVESYSVISAVTEGYHLPSATVGQTAEFSAAVPTTLYFRLVASEAGRYILSIKKLETRDDHGNDFAHASECELGEISGQYNSIRDDDWFRFTAQSEGNYTVILQCDGDAYLGLIRGDLSETAYNDDHDELNSQIVIHLGEGETLYIGALNRFENVCPYTLTVREGGDLSENTSPEETPTEIVEGPDVRVDFDIIRQLIEGDGPDTFEAAIGNSINSEIHDALDYAGDQDWYRVEIDEKTNLTIYTKGSVDVYLQVLREDGEVIAEDDDSGEAFNPYVNIDVDGPTTIYVGVKAFVEDITGEYTLYIDGNEGSSVSTGNDEAPNTPTEARGNSFLAEVSGEINPSDDRDWYRLEANRSGVLELRVESDFDAYMFLVDKDGMALTEDDDGAGDYQPRIEWSVTEGDVLFVGVASYEGSETGSYKLIQSLRTGDTVVPPPATFEGDAPDEWSEAEGNVGLGAIAAALDVAGDTDWYRFVAPADGILVVETLSQIDMYLLMYDSGGSWLGEDDDGGTGRSGNDLDARLQGDVLENDVLYIGVRGYDGTQTGNYTLDLTFSEGGPTVVEDDAPNSWSEATGNRFGEEFTGRVDFAGDVDWYRFEVTGPGVAAFRTTGDSDTYLILANSEGLTVMEDDDSAGELNGLVEHEVGDGETLVLYVGVKMFDDVGTGTYGFASELRASPEGDDDEAPGRPLEAEGDFFGQEITGNLTPGDVDWYRMQVQGPGTATFRTVGDPDTYLLLADANGEIIVEDDDSGADLYPDDGEFSACIAYRIEDNREALLYIGVRFFDENSEGRYKLISHMDSERVDEPIEVIEANSAREDELFESGDAPDFPEDCEGSQLLTIDASFGKESDVDCYRVEAPADGTIRAFTEGDSDCFLEILDENFEIIAADDDSGGELNSLIEDIEVKEGEVYFVRVTNYDSASTGLYRVTIEVR